VSTATSWSAALDLLEERIRRQAAVIALQSDRLPDDELPVVDGPLPLELKARALTLLQRTRDLELMVETRLALTAPRRPSYGDATTDRGTDHGAL
jgi:hypothetical protein